jgi:hypothetical protein
MLIGLRLLSVIAIAFLVILEDKISTPVCNNHVEEVDDDDLKVMMVADLLLFGSDATYINSFFRDHYMSKFFRVPSLSIHHLYGCFSAYRNN